MKNIKAAGWINPAALKKMIQTDGKQLNNIGNPNIVKSLARIFFSRYLYRAFVVFVAGIIKTDLI